MARAAFERFCRIIERRGAKPDDHHVAVALVAALVPAMRVRHMDVSAALREA